jgi:hypothetical protein
MLSLLCLSVLLPLLMCIVLLVTKTQSCHRSGGCLQYAKGLRSVSTSIEAINTVSACVDELRMLRQEMLAGERPVLPLFSMPPEKVRAIFICKVLLPSGSYKNMKEALNLRAEVSVPVAERICPLFLVDVGEYPASATQPPGAFCTRHTPPPVPAPPRASAHVPAAVPRPGPGQRFIEWFKKSSCCSA